MILRRLVAALALSLSSAAAAAPPPPLPVEEQQQLEAFVRALPKAIPDDLSAFASFVSPDVQVFQSGRLAYPSRDSWFAHLRSYAASDPAEPRGVSVSRESFYRGADGGLVVLEFAYPLLPKGMEGQIVYHPADPLRFVTYHLEQGRLVRVDYGQPMRSYDYLLKPASESGSVGAGSGSCPTQPEPSPLTSAAFEVPAGADTLLFSAAPSVQSVRYALQIVRPAGSKSSTAKLVRLQRRFDCNVHDLAGSWTLELTPAETLRLFDAAAQLQRQGEPDEIVVDGTTVELKRYSAGKLEFNFASNALAKDALSDAVLTVLKSHLNAAELPAAGDWRFKLPGSSL